jgi:hypothetical protein
MKQRHLNIIFAVGIIVCGWLSLRHEKTPTQTQPINYQLLKYRYEESQKRTDTLQLQVNQKDTTIYENSNFVRTSDRSRRDSLRAIYNRR